MEIKTKREMKVPQVIKLMESYDLLMEDFKGHPANGDGERRAMVYIKMKESGIENAEIAKFFGKTTENIRNIINRYKNEKKAIF